MHARFYLNVKLKKVDLMIGTRSENERYICVQILVRLSVLEFMYIDS